MRHTHRTTLERRQARNHVQDGTAIDGVTQGPDLVGPDVVSSVADRRIGSNHANVAVATRTKIVKDSGSNRALHQLDGLFFGHILLPGGLHNGHGSQRTRSHGRVTQLGRRSVRGDLVDARSVNVAAAQDQGGRDVSLETEETAFEERTGRDDPGRAVSVHSQQLELTGDELSDLFGVGGRSCSAAVHVRTQVVNLFAILFSDFRSGRGAGISAQDDAVVIDDTHDGGTGLFGDLGEHGSAGEAQDHVVPQRVFKRETGRLGDVGGGGVDLGHGHRFGDGDVSVTTR
mmetsp:Transcript_13568/g.21364  ORF Transcript_13568/g.21364 Transcript_13568/m.21364 type:complete len:287 (-) Transcript_13568:95-955(-)